MVCLHDDGCRTSIKLGWISLGGGRRIGRSGSGAGLCRHQPVGLELTFALGLDG